MTETVQVIAEFILKVAQRQREAELKKNFLWSEHSSLFQKFYQKISKNEKIGKIDENEKGKIF